MVWRGSAHERAPEHQRGLRGPNGSGKGGPCDLWAELSRTGQCGARDLCQLGLARARRVGGHYRWTDPPARAQAGARRRRGDLVLVCFSVRPRAPDLCRRRACSNPIWRRYKYVSRLVVSVCSACLFFPPAPKTDDRYGPGSSAGDGCLTPVSRIAPEHFLWGEGARPPARARRTLTPRVCGMVWRPLAQSVLLRFGVV